MDTENRSILIFFSIFVLLVFLDHQSAMQLHRNGLGTGLEQVRADELLRSGSPGISSNPEDTGAGVENLYLPAIDPAVTSERPGKKSTVDEATRGKDPTREKENPGVSQKQDQKKPFKLKEISLENISGSLPVLPTVENDGHEWTSLSLYYPGFHGRQTDMVRVRRKVPGRVDAWNALRLLQKGPESKEKGLVNAVDQSVGLDHLEFAKGVVTVFAGPGMHRMSASILHDRLDQICLTLFQFPRVKGVRLIVEGKAVNSLGRSRDAIAVPAVIGRVNRPIQDYRDF